MPIVPPQVSRVATEGEQGGGRGAEQQRVDHPRIPLGERIEHVGEGEDHMEVGNREEVGLRAWIQRALPCA
jgi:hypothetical protein